MNKLLIIYLMLYVGCAVEAGNPNDDKDKGTVKISIAGEDESSDLNLMGGPRLQLFLRSVQLRGYDSDGNDVWSELEPINSDVELFEIEDTLLATADDIEVGNYHTVFLVLETDNPFDYRPDGMTSKPLRFQDDTLRAIQISQDFVVSHDNDEELLIDFDLVSSISESGGEYIFRPRVRPHRKRELNSYTGNVEKEGGIVACGYVYAPLGHKHGPRPPLADGQMPPEGMKPPPPPPGALGEQPPVFPTKEDVILDDTKACPNAFGIAPIQENGDFYFPRLKPGTYIFRVFYEDGSFENVGEDVELLPPPRALRNFEPMHRRSSP